MKKSLSLILLFGITTWDSSQCMMINPKKRDAKKLIDSQTYFMLLAKPKKELKYSDKSYEIFYADDYLMDYDKHTGKLKYPAVIINKDNYSLIQLKVMDQSLTLADIEIPAQLKDKLKEVSFTTNIGGGSESCGYHSIKNAILINNLFKGTSEASLKELLTQSQETKFVYNLFGKKEVNELLGVFKKDGLWRQQIIDIRKEYKKEIEIKEKKDKGTIKDLDLEEADLKGEYLSETEIFSIYNFLKSKHTEYPEYWSFGYEDLFGETKEFVAEPAFEDINKKYKDKEDFAIIFFITDGLSHWVSLVLKKIDGKLYYIIADSLNEMRYVVKTKEVGQKIQKMIKEIIEKTCSL